LIDLGKMSQNFDLYFVDDASSLEKSKMKSIIFLILYRSSQFDIYKICFFFL
jgi:hypothetical protein